MSKIQIESNSQRVFYSLLKVLRCVYHVKDTNRKQFTTGLYLPCYGQPLCLSCQRYKSKAIHNKVTIIQLSSAAVFIMSKIQIESNSQQRLNLAFRISSCVYHVKDTNRKQFTTRLKE